jgi:hypothetical protein
LGKNKTNNTNITENDFFFVCRDIMAMSLKFEDGVTTLRFLGCHGACYPGHGHLVEFKEKFNPRRSTPITRLLMHKMFGREHKLDGILENFTKYFEDSKHQNEDGVDVFKKLILEDHEKDPTWKICHICKDEYATKKRTWENIVYVTPTVVACDEHST